MGAVPAPVQNTEDWALRRVAAHGNLVAYWRTGNERRLEWYVAIVGENGTFESDFAFESDLRYHMQHGRPALYPRCSHCWQRKPLASFRHDRKALHGHAARCKACEDGGEDEYNWRRNPSDVRPVLRIVPKEEPTVRFPICPCCGERFETTIDEQIYCSKRCKRTAQTRRYRERMKQAG